MNDGEDLSSFMGTPYSEKHGIEVELMDTTNAEQQVQDELDIQRTAEEIWNDGMALEYMCNSCAKIHVGDRIAIRSMLLSYASTRIVNGEGLHISISGSAGTGKSHAAATAAKHLPVGAVMDARLSDKALYYHNVQPRTVLLLDDQELTDDFQELLKVASTDWTKPAKYLTVNNQKPVELQLPECCPFWVVKANLNGDEQVLDRQLVIWTDESREQRISIQKAIFQAAANPEMQMSDGDSAICRAIWMHVPQRNIVTVPYAEQIRCDEYMDPRNIKILISLIQAIALMHGPQRRCGENCSETNTQEERTEVVTATMEDFKEAARIINPLLENKGGSQKLKLSSGASKVLTVLTRYTEQVTITFEEMRKETGMNMSQLSCAIYGRDGRQTDGLQGVCPALEVVEDTVVKNSGGTTRRKAIRWNPDIYMTWQAASGMFYLDC